MQHYCLTDKSIFVEDTDPRLDYGREWAEEDMEDGCRQYAHDLSDYIKAKTAPKQTLDMYYGEQAQGDPNDLRTLR